MIEGGVTMTEFLPGDPSEIPDLAEPRPDAGLPVLGSQQGGYGHVAPAATMAPQARPGVAPSPQPTPWSSAPPAWAPPAAKRKAWPWVVGVLGFLVVAGGAAAVGLGVLGDLTADQNANYDGAPVTMADAPTIGSEVVVSPSGSVAFEIDSGWVPVGSYLDLEAVSASLPPEASFVGAFFTSDPTTARSVVPTLVMVLEGSPEGQVGSVDVDKAHAEFVAGGVQSLASTGLTAVTSEPRSVVTANGLEGQVSDLSLSVDGAEVRAYEFTFARSERVVFVQVMAYTDEFDTAAAALVTDSLRIDK